MGKYMRKSKVTGDVVTVMEPTTTTLGVRTRARTLALQRLRSSPSSTPRNPEHVSCPSSSSMCYLQLRSRRLEKPAFADKGNPLKPSLKGKEEEEREGEEEEKEGLFGFNNKEGCELDEASFGDNCFDSELPRDRSTRESTPCSLIRDSEAIGTPGSTTRKASSTTATRRIRDDSQRNLPTTNEMEEFFAFAEGQQQRLFLEKYNFDVVNDLPLPGRYEWFQVVP